MRLARLASLMALPLWAQHQPVMDMSPRWSGGSGFQLRRETQSTDALLKEDVRQPNPLGLDRSLITTWLEGVYTFRREVRLTLKLPYVEARRRALVNGQPYTQEARGLGDAVIGLPLKRYWNSEEGTVDAGFTPSLRLPTGRSEGKLPLGRGSTDLGLGLSMSVDRADLYQYYAVYQWANGRGTSGFRRGNEVGFVVNLGLHPYHDNSKDQGVFLMLDLSGRREAPGRNPEGLITGGERIQAGPVLVFYRRGMMARAELGFPLRERVEGIQPGRGKTFNVGVGFNF